LALHLILFRGEWICRKDEPIDMFIIVLYGSLRVGKNNTLTDD
jgi:CRP-like cAMP-binding protein